MVTEGGVFTIKFTPLLFVPPTLTTTLPVVAPAGTGAVMLVALHAVGVPRIPLNITVLVPCGLPKFVPMITTGVLTTPEVGLSPVIVGEVPTPETDLNAAKPAAQSSAPLIVALATAPPATL